MNKLTAAIFMASFLAACDESQPFFKDDDTTTTSTNDATGGDNPDDGTDSEDPLNTGTVRPPINGNQLDRGDILRVEAGGLLASVEYVASNDTLIVDGLGFDGANTYSRGSPIAQLNSHQVYEADVVAFDELTGDAIEQVVPYRAIYGVSNNSLATGEPRTSFTIVRTGWYADYGYGGFMYERNGSTVIPTTGQAQFKGDYAGLRVFDIISGLELTKGNVTIAVDLRDFNTNDAIKGTISNRFAYTPNGSALILGTYNDEGLLILPDIHFAIEGGSGGDIAISGEFAGQLGNSASNSKGEISEYEKGNYYAVMSGDTTDVADGGEIVGIFVIESEDPRYTNVVAQETGGFIAYR